MINKKRSIIYTGLPVGAALLLLLAFFFALPGGGVAAPEATVLQPGDIAIIGVGADDPDDFAFVALVDIEAGTEIRFTDSGWLDTNTFRGNEGATKYTAPSAISAGTIISFVSNATDFVADNDATVGTNGFSLSTSGDQVIAFQGTSDSPSFVYAVQTNSTLWQTTASSSNDSALPLGLTDGTTAVAVGVGTGSGDEYDNSVYDMSTTSGTQAELLAAISDAANWLGSNDPVTMPSGSFTVGSGAAAHLLLTEISVTPTAGEFIEIYNPTGAAIDLSDVYLTDATYAGGSTYYYNIVTGTNAGGGSFGDFHARFPDGASIAPGEYQVIALAGSGAFSTTYGVNPTYELFEDDGSPDSIPDMREAFSGSINNQGGLTNDGEVVIMYTWDGLNDLVTDVDYVVWGDKAEAVDKTGVSIDGPDGDVITSTYQADTAIGSQDVAATGSHLSGYTWQRQDLAEGMETASGGNGVDGNDETSENLSSTWCEELPSPLLATTCGLDDPPTVSSTTPANNALSVAFDSNIAIGFSENVTVTGTWYDITCDSSGVHTATVSGGPQDYSLDPAVDFAAAESCSVTIYAAQVTDQDGTPDNMEADYVFSFDTLACGAPATFIHTIQGSGGSSPEVGNVHTIEGVVVGDYQAPGGGINGFFVQEEDTDADADPMTSEGILVYDGYSPAVDVSVGQIVRVSGTVVEYNGLTELGSITDVGICPGSATASPAQPTLPIADNANWEWYEGMLVNFTQTLYVTEHYNLGRYGEISLSVNDRLGNPTQVITPGLDANALQDLNDRSRIELDDAITAQNPDPIIYPSPELSATNTLRGGDSLPGLTGVMHYAYSMYLVEPVGPITFTHSNPRTSTPAAVGGSLQVASFNVLNYFSTIDTGAAICGPLGNLDCRGANSESEFTRQRDKIISAILEMDADIVGLIEIENHATDEAVDDLLNGLNAIAGAGTYAKVATGPIGDDAIKVALIYQPATATPIGSYAILDDSFDPNYREDRNRPALAQTFADANGGKVTVIVNHFKSKGSACDDIGDPDTGDGQGNCNLTRLAAANIMLDWLDTDPTASGSPNFLIIGDLNSYAMEDPIVALEAGGFTNLYRTFGEDDYSYVFSGQWGTLDYSLASAALLPEVTGATAWHINSDEPRVLDYNEEFKTIHQIESLYAPDAYRASDHDPIIVGLDLSFELPNASFVSNSPITLGEIAVYTNTSTGSAPLTYLWDFGDSITSTLESPTHIYEMTGVYTVTLQVSNIYGSDVFTDTFTVEAVTWELILPLIFKQGE